MMTQRTFSSNLKSKINKDFLYKGTDTQFHSLKAREVFFFRNGILLMASTMFVCNFKTDELSQILMRRSLAKLKQAASLLSGFLSFL